jgi:hypothetical protein
MEETFFLIEQHTTEHRKKKKTGTLCLCQPGPHHGHEGIVRASRSSVIEFVVVAGVVELAWQEHQIDRYVQRCI